MATRTTTRLERHPTATPARVRLARWRINALLLFALLLFSGVFVRLGDLQVVRHEELRRQAFAVIDQQITLQPTRGVITDRLGNVLAMDVDRESLWAIPAQINPEHAPRLALILSPLVGRPPDQILADLTNTKFYWLPIKRWLEPEVAAQIESLKEPGLRLEYEPRRVYPQNEFAAQLIGAVNFEGNGISGIEGFYNSQLRGITGTLTAEFDGARNPIAIAPSHTIPARNGVNIQTTIDPLIQHVIERELKTAVERHNADGGSIVVIEPRTGAIRGMASWPPFDPNNYLSYDPEVYGRNPAVSNLYEPGSTFKMITVAAGLQSRAFTADTQVNDTGTIYRYGYWLKNWNAGANGMLDSTGVIYYSSNVGALLLNELTGPDNFYRIVSEFGFGRPTGVELGGEEAGIVHPPGSPLYNDLTFLINAYGQSISVTPLQMTAAAAAIANDGVLMRPYIIERVCEGEVCTDTQPTVMSRPVEPGVAWTVRRMMVKSANHYSPVVWGPRIGVWSDQWLVPGYQIGAKTGTSSIPLPGGGYDPSFTIGSVLGFAPAEGAQYAVLVKIDRPKDDIWGVGTAIPVFYKVMDEILRYARIPPDPNLVSPGQR
ncbi:MAG: peptidoglycan D,D-transpeptidase FtsI family protein [Oscillochloridaceae bacterium umkhey_bin13]